MFLSRADLHALTGYRQPARMRAWLEAHRWRHVVSAAGWPVVALSEAERARVLACLRVPYFAAFWRVLASEDD